MSKITKALEKAARERLERLQAKPTTSAQPKEVALEIPQAAEAVAMDQDHVKIDPHIVSATDHSSPIAEQYRILRTNLLSLPLRAGARIFVVTSAVHAEGKSVTSLNLALTFARQDGLRVVLVDADLRKGTIHKWLGLPARPEGLSRVLARGGELNGSLLRLKEPPLAILPAGQVSDQPAELLGSAAMKRLLSTLQSQFDVIVVDSPPVLPVTDAGILGAKADGVLLVARAGKTQRRTVLQAHRLLGQMNAPVLGCILTHVDYYLPEYYRYRYAYRYGAPKPYAQSS